MIDVKVIDADGHVIEDDEALLPYLEPPYRGRKDLLTAPFFPSLDGWHRAALRIADGKSRDIERPDASAWVDFMDQAEIEWAVLYPTNGLGYGLIKQVEWAVALARAYNNWLHDQFLSRSPRLKGAALIPLQEISEAVKELRRAVTQLGMVGAILPAVGLRRPLGDASYNPIYEEAQALGCMLAVHGAPAQQLGFDFFERFIQARLNHPLSQIIQFTSMIFEGVPDRFPRLRLAFMEAGCGWVPYLIDRMDRDFEHRSRQAPHLTKPPSEHVRSGQIFFHCETEESTLPYAIKLLGAERFFIASDFPHEPADEIREAIGEFLRRSDLNDEIKHALLYRNPTRLYGG